MWSEYKIDEQIKIKSMYSLFEAEYEDKFSFPGESHNFWECFYVKSGSACVSADGSVYNLEDNEMIFHKPMEMHKFYINNPNGAKLFIFSFSAEGKAMDFFRNKVFHLLDIQKNIIYNMLEFIHTKMEEYPPPEDIYLPLTYLYPFDKSQTYSQIVTAYIAHLLLSLCDDNSISSVSDSPDAKIFQKSVDFMNNNIDMQPTIAEIASYNNISETGLKRIFYKYSGMSVHKYFIKLRIKAAAGLLRSGIGVTEVAERLGFGSQGYFSAVFKRETGLSPTEFKNNPDLAEY